VTRVTGLSKKATIAALAALVLLAAPAVTTMRADDDAAELLARLRSLYDKADDISLTFEQKTTFAVSSSEQTSAGKVLIKGKRYRVESGGRTIISDGQSVWSYSEEANQVVIDHLRDDAGSPSPGRLLTGLSDDYDAFILEDQGDEKVLKLVPRKRRASVKSMKLRIDDDDLMIRSVEIVDRAGNTTLYRLTNIAIDGGIGDGQFEPRFPDKAEVFDLR
jgi:chaperone LolA